MDERFHLNVESDDAPRNAPPVASSRPARSGYDDSVLATREVHLLDYVKVLYKRRWTAIATFVIIFGSVTFSTFTATPIYEARTRLLIESDDQNVVSFRQVVEEDQTKADYYQTQYNILRSRNLARKTLTSLDLWDKAPFGGPAGVPGFSVRGAVRSGLRTIGSVFRSDEPEAASVPGADETAAQSRAIDAFLGGLTVTEVRNSRLVDVKYRSANPQQATAIVNELAKNYIEQNLEFKFMASKEANDWLGERLAEQRTQVENAEAALQRYREQNDAISLEDRENIVVQKLGDLNAAVTRAKTERIQKEAVYNQLRESQGNPASLDTFPAILANGFIQQLKGELSSLQQQQAQLNEKFGDRHPDVIKVRSAIQLAQTKLNGEIGKVVQSVRSEYQSALAQESSLQAALNQQKGEALSMNRKAIDYGVLERDVESSKQIYQSLMQRAKETGVAGELRTSNIRVVDPAETPRSPVLPRTRVNLLAALIGGLALAVGLVIFFEYLDNRIKTPDQIKSELGLPFLGLIPVIRDSDAKVAVGESPLISGGVPAAFAEAFRVVRTNVLFSSAEGSLRSLVVTSTGPGEGKSLVCSNLAVGLAQSGQRVLLIDADMRRPRMHSIFQCASEPGLSNLMVGNAKAADAVKKTSVPGLWILPSGKTPPNPTELLGAARFREFLNTLKDHFDVVLIDSPPVMAVADASVIAHSASAVLFVVGSEMTSRHAARVAVEQLDASKARFIGAVLNRVDLTRHSYYYSQYYRPEYAKYYAETA